MYTWLFTQTPLLFFVQSFWRDEAFSYLLAKKNIGEILFITARDFNPPLYYFVAHFWMKIFGTSEIALRSLSLIFYWATIYIVFLFLTEIFKFSFKKSLFYLFLSIINPLLVYYAFEARMYSMLAFFATLSFYAFYKKHLRLYLLSSVFGLYTHYFMIFAIFAQIIFEGRSLISPSSRRYRRGFLKPMKSFDSPSTSSGSLRMKLGTMTQLHLITFFLFLPWLFFVLIQKGSFWGSFWIGKMTFDSFFSLLGRIYTGYEPGFKFYDPSILKLSAGFIFLIIIGFLKIRQEKIAQKKFLYYLLWWGVGIPLITGVISSVKPLFLPRYLIFSTVGFLLLLIFILERLPPTLRAAILIIILVTTLKYHQLQIKNRQKADLRRVIKEIKYLAKKDDFLYVTSELDFHVAQYYFDENRVFIYGKTYEEIPNFVGKVLIPKSKVVNSLPRYPKKAFILTSDSNYEIQAAF